MAPRKRLGDILQDGGLITEEQLKEALEMQRRSGEKLGEALVKLRFVTPGQIADALSEHLGIERVDFQRRYLSNDIVGLISEELIRSHQVLPLDLDGATLSVAMTDPFNIMAIDDLQRVTGYSIRPLVATAQEIQEAFQRTTDVSSNAQRVISELAIDFAEEITEDVQQFIGDAPGVKLANMILKQGVSQKASDIHIEPREEDMLVRFRVDGIMREVMVVPRSLRNDVTSRVKIMANLDITERRRPQDGRIQMSIDGFDVDMRMSTLPTVYGEKIVARILNKSDNMLTVQDFGFLESSTEKIYRMLRQKQGLVLVTGPTGSGKTTTLYGFLNEVNSPEMNVITIEDPVEYRLDGINQVQTNVKVGLTFAAGLRTVLRQDPDIIMVGEIRDHETAEIAVRSALTGHLVLSTLHTNSAVATIGRLVDMGLEPYLLTSTVIGVIAQRLVRKICKDCRTPEELKDPLVIRFIRSLKVPVPNTVYRGRGCPLCSNTGYRGRLAIEEVLLMTKTLRNAIEARIPETRLEELAMQSGMISLQHNAVMKLTAGITTSDEVIRTVYSVDDDEEGEE